LPTISSPRNVTVTADITATAAVVQAEIDRLAFSFGVSKIILASHLQDVANDRALVKLLRGVDVAIAGGGDELLVSSSVPTTTQLLPGEVQSIAGTYPLMETDALGRPVYIVTTAGNYKYLGRLDVQFNEYGEIAQVITATSYPRPVIPTGTVATQLGLAQAVTPDAGIVASVETPVKDCIEMFRATPVARTEVLIDVSRAGVRSRETNMGNLVTDAYLYLYDQLAASNGLEPRSAANPVIAFNNGGGIRQNAGNQISAGAVISRLTTLDILPFDNYITVVEGLTPSELKTIFERSAASLPGEGGQFLQVAGITVTVNISAPVGSRVVSLLLADGRPIIQDGRVVAGAPTVAAVTNSFTARGGDDYPTLAAKTDKTNLTAAGGAPIAYEEALRLYLQSLPVSGSPALPTVLASDPRYAQATGQGRIVKIAQAPLLVLYLTLLGR
jgi:2',3'-cyclic-nucleotide 2'-phosphodiesterase (5'-nucleotidase family)